MTHLIGLIAATFTPLNSQGDLDLDRIPGMIEYLLAQGVDGFYVLGSTGEGVSFTLQERIEVAEAFIAAVAGRKPVIVQVGHNSLRESCQLAEHAAQAGATAVSSTPPSYFRLTSVPSLVECISEVAGAAAGLPFYYYHIPAVTGAAVDMPDFLMRAGEVIPNLAGVKFTSPAIWEYQMCVELDAGRFDCLYGHDEMLLPSLAVGARGAVGSTYNFGAPLYRRVIQAFEERDFVKARQLQAKANAMIRALLRNGGLPAMKATMGLMGYDCGPIRKPLLPLSTQQLDQLMSDLTQAGFLHTANQSFV